MALRFTGREPEPSVTRPNGVTEEPQQNAAANSGASAAN